jgi:7-cyano-7-deazaguanosine (preQ0) biosynthesis protein QueE
MKLFVNEIFGPTFQGEGKSLGKEVIFVRLAFCNLSCVWCDTPYTWKFVEHDRAKEVTSMMIDEVVDRVAKLGQTKAIVISGGEPLLQQKALIELVAKFKTLSYWIEIETNGTIVLHDELVRLTDQFNCSPKLSNSGNPKTKAINEQALTKLSQIGSTFKFVLSDYNQIAEINELVRRFEMKQVYLMGEGVTVEALREREAFVRAVCERNGYIYSPRLQVERFGQKRGV